ncbi:hypothetical protein SPI_05975 [Niveomyces insectorum RCEF 264]|uniref:Uncharacterized protein n=1 Tax=Niveomyces insectorum RCEF 264 TaxID=1081102 RepID=A0A167SN98_9HYPO|nr:hypothetical protein SPI_05975 [Niveomyces insectorum RCEF 264]
MVDETPGSAAAPYRAFLPDLSQPRFTTMQTQDAHSYAAAFKTGRRPPWLHALYEHWQALWQEPYRGVTNDGHVRPGLFPLEDEGVDDAAVGAAADRVVALVQADPQLRAKQLVYHIDDPSWRTWSNPEFLLSDRGVRLDEVGETVRTAVLDVLRAALSPEGFAKAQGAMRINGFLGALVGAEAVVNEWSYNFVLYGVFPVGGGGGGRRPWGFSFYGHHLCLNAFFTGGGQMVLSPVFVGAEPNVIDRGPNGDEGDDHPYVGTRILVAEEALGLRLMRSLAPAVQAQATVYAQLRDPAMPHGRWNHDDQRHLCGAARDNRVVPYEGVASPVLLVEFDHHSGVFLTNAEPARFHIHTIVRTPNAGDYGMALRPLLPSTVEQKFIWEGDQE